MGTTPKPPKADALKNQLQQQGSNRLQQTPPPQVTGIKSLMNSDAVKSRFEEVLKDRAPQFMASIINLVNTSPELQNADGKSVLQSAMVAAALNLPVDKNLGYMWIIGRRDNKRGGMVFASPQLGYKGYIQLALRTAQYKNINVITVYEGEYVSWNRLTEKLVLDLEGKMSDAPVGYAATFTLLNGFTKSVYWTVADVMKHKERFSKTDKFWISDPEEMAQKTVLKAMLSKWGVLSIEMQKAFDADREEVGEGDTGGAPLSDPFDIPGNVIDVDMTTGEIVDPITSEESDLPQ